MPIAIGILIFINLPKANPGRKAAEDENGQ
jgi:hypothetical protein